MPSYTFTYTSPTNVTDQHHHPTPFRGRVVV
jgi:hypothetical protein